MQDKIIETKICPISGEEFTITQSDLDFYDKISPTFGVSHGQGGGGFKFQLPTPTLSPTERQRRRLSFRNERNLYKRKCDASGKDIISIYAPVSSLSKVLTTEEQERDPQGGGFKVYDQKIRRSDSRDALDYGQEFDFSKTFTENFRELMNNVPKMNLINMNSENSEYCNPGFNNKNCYLIYSITNSQDCVYGRWIDDCFDCFDCLAAKKSSLCYQCVSISNCNSCTFCVNCEDCSFCINCVGLQNMQYCIENKQYSKEEFNTIRQASNIRFNISFFEKNKDLSIIDIGNENCTGILLKNCSNCQNCYEIEGGEDLRYCDLSKTGAKDSISSSLLFECSLVQEGVSIFQSSNVISSNFCRHGSQICYSNECFYSNNLFGCIGLRNKSYCIFNKQYTKEDYELTVSKIISHMMTTGERGEFFHPSLSPFGYNETVAQEYYPIGRDMLVACPTNGRITNATLQQRGYHRSDYQSPTPLADKIIEGKDLPDTIEEVHDNILKIAIKCEITGKLFRIIPQELAFYRKHNIPLPRRHPDQRHLDRLALRK